MSQTDQVFLTADWLGLVMLNYEVDPRLLERHVPYGTSLDSFAGKTYVSLVGFRFCKTKIFGRVSVPFHTNFDEVNLRFYVRRKEGNEVRRGVVFIAEIVPRYAIAKLARLVYGENYFACPMKHRIDNGLVSYQWKLAGGWCNLSATVSGNPEQTTEGSLEQFITEHYWGYSSQRSGACIEYRVAHVPWKVWRAAKASFEGDVASFYGEALASVLKETPQSAFVADGSEVSVHSGKVVV